MIVKEIKAVASMHKINYETQYGTTRKRSTTAIKMSGKYLENAGINKGDKLKVTITNGKITIEKI